MFCLPTLNPAPQWTALHKVAAMHVHTAPLARERWPHNSRRTAQALARHGPHHLSCLSDYDTKMPRLLACDTLKASRDGLLSTTSLPRAFGTSRSMYTRTTDVGAPCRASARAHMFQPSTTRRRSGSPRTRRARLVPAW